MQMNEKMREDEAKLAQVRQHIATVKLDTVLPISLSLQEAVYYLAVMRLGATEDLNFINPVYTFPSPLSPSEDFDREILESLWNLGIIKLSSESRIDAFVINDDGRVGLYTHLASWEPLVRWDPASDPYGVRFFEDAFQEAFWHEGWSEEVLNIGRRIALEECLQYLVASLDEHHLPFTIGEKTKIAINLALDTFSVSQIYNFIWRAARDAAAFYQRGGVAKTHAANTVVGNIQRYAERARDENWDVKGYSRSRSHPRSMISQVFFSTVLHIGDGGFTIPPNRWQLPEFDIFDPNQRQAETAPPAEIEQEEDTQTLSPKNANPKNPISRRQKKRRRR